LMRKVSLRHATDGAFRQTTTTLNRGSAVLVSSHG
jgi:hypothetical protein